MHSDTEVAANRPAERRFRAPKDIIESTELSTLEKIEALENWKLDLLELQTASEENMAGNEREDARVSETMREVNSALATLRAHEVHSSP